MSIEARVLGCGEAFDETLPNTSLLIHAGTHTCLLDCGYSVPPALWKAVPGPDDLDLIYLSHSHADHYYGIPAVITRMWEENRSRPLTVVGQASLTAALPGVIEAGYRNIFSRLSFPLRFVDAEAGSTLELEDLQLDFAPTAHAVENLAVRLKHGDVSVFYSGDGEITPESRHLAEDVDLLFHEAFKFEHMRFHSSIPQVVELAKRARRGALVHIQREVRKDKYRILNALAHTAVSMPEPGEVFHA